MSKMSLMAPSRRLLILGAALSATALVLPGCATRVKASALTNPAPARPFSDFGRIVLKPIRIAPGAEANVAGVNKIKENIEKNLSPSLQTWNKGPDNGRTLSIEPVVLQMQFQHGAKRVLLGPLAGSSGVLIELRITDGQGSAVATPQFFQRADAWAAGFVMGVHDNLMLTRVAELASTFVVDNYAEAKGGPTGADDKAMARH